MAKSKKNRQADFQKVKLKVGKKLKKADNVTKTNFQTRKIQVTQQLKTGHETAPSTRKKQNITELFTQCRHYSVSVRQEAVTGLKELVTTFPETIQSHMADLLEKTAELLTDKDPKVRQGAVRLLKTCLPKISEKLISPFFPLLCAHLCCAMTHIVDEIQVDSLPVLDILLEQYPRLLIKASNQVLSNFIEQISRQKGHGDAKRSLATNPNSRTSSQKWRKSVFDRLQKFLTAILNCHTNSVYRSVNDNAVLFNFGMASDKGQQVFPQHFQTYWESSGFTLSSVVADQPSSSAGTIGDRLRDFATTLMPLLLESWVEAAPSQNTALDMGHQLLPENAAAMYSILQVTQSLMESLDVYCLQQDAEQWPRSRYMKECSKHFLINFPFEVYTPPSKGDKKEKKDFEPVSADSLNLTICEIMSRFIPGHSDNVGRLLPPWLGAITSYLQEFLGGHYNRGTVSRSCQTVVRIVNRLIQAGIDDESVSDILSAMFQRFKGGNRLTSEKQAYLQFFAAVLLDSYQKTVISPEIRQSFLQSLPELLPLAIEDNPKMAALVVSVMKQAACQQCLVFGEADLDRIQQWFDPVRGLIIKFPARERQSLMSLLYSLPQIGMEFTRILMSLARYEGLEESETAFLLQTLQNRYIKYGETPSAAKSHISLLCQLVLGMTKDEVHQAAACQASLPASDAAGGYNIVSNQEASVNWKKHSYIVQVICGIIGQCRNSTDITTIMFKVIESFLKANKTIPVQVVFGICSFAYHQTDVPPSLAPALAILCTSAVVGAQLMRDGDTCDPEFLLQLQEMSCHLLLFLPGGLVVMTSQVQRTNSGSLPDILTALVMAVHRLLTLGTVEKLRPRGQEFSDLLEAVKQKTEQATLSGDITRLIAEMDYTLTTVS